MKFSGSACTAGRVGKLLANNEVTPVTAETDRPFCVFLKDYDSSTNTKYMGKNGELPVAINGATIETTAFNSSNKPVVANIIGFSSTGVPQLGSGAGTYAIGECSYVSSTKIQFQLNIDLATDF
jgi:isopentenyl diphosphate isomerase/L-lactate dehydrogenase-like FMN-dependent dehydrogenase